MCMRIINNAEPSFQACLIEMCTDYIMHLPKAWNSISAWHNYVYANHLWEILSLQMYWSCPAYMQLEPLDWSDDYLN